MTLGQEMKWPLSGKGGAIAFTAATMNVNNVQSLHTEHFCWFTQIKLKIIQITLKDKTRANYQEH